MYRKRGRKPKIYRQLRKHPLIVVSILWGLAVSIVVGYLFDMGVRVDLLCGLFNSIVLVLIARRFKKGGIYGWDVMHPITGDRVCGYVGQTVQKTRIDRDGYMRVPRIEQHLYGSSYWGIKPAVWSDTAITWYWIKRPGYRTKRRLNVLEYKSIQRHLPIYNDRMNRSNPYRIKKSDAKVLRAQRDNGICPPGYQRAV